MSESEFWGSTPAQLRALAEEHSRREERNDRRLASLMCLVANINRGKGKSAYKTEDFMPKKPPTASELERKLNAFAEVFQTFDEKEAKGNGN